MLCGAEQLPVAPGTVIHRGDMPTIHGLEPAVNRMAALVGNVSRRHRTPTQASVSARSSTTSARSSPSPPKIRV